MRYSPSVLASAIILSFSVTANAGVAQRRGYTEAGTPSKYEKALWSLRSLVGKRQDLYWEDTAAWRILSSGTREDQNEVCNKLIGPLPPTTVEVDYTPAAA